MLGKRWEPERYEKEIYQFWERGGWFPPKVEPSKKPFCIIMPPPNANGALHIGHARFITIEDILIRFRRMQGYSTLWLPGADHAGILTQVVFERELAKKGKTRFDLGREKFVKACYRFSQKNKRVMYSQIKALGGSCDWTREHFTLEPEISKVVLETFVELYQDGLVYRGKRMINWCPRCQTALSDLEVEHKEEKTKLWFIKYGPLIVATTRPETMLGDTAVAVHPKDKRYQSLIGKKITLPLVGREIPVIADEAVDPKFGTGVVKVTPAHDPVDFEIGQRHKLSFIQVIGFDGKMTKEAGRFAGLRVEQARKAVLAELKKQGLLVKEESYTHSVGVCERCKTKIEPLVSLQWFVETKPLAKKVIEVVEKGEVKIFPRRFKKVLLHWLTNIRDWCVSRQLWWGHQLPIWYCGKRGLSPLQLEMNPDLAQKPEGCGEVFVGLKPPDRCPRCGKSVWLQDPDTLDTWFSSGQWPYTTLGFPNSPDYRYFYPTSVMETGWDILFFWVARMLMLGIYKTGKVPFFHVLLHGLVRDEKGEKMSKSKGNVIDPLLMAEKYGADAVRLSLVYGSEIGRDLNLGEKKIEAMRNFTNKVWNASRFVLLNLEKHQYNKPKSVPPAAKGILEEKSKLVKKVTQLLEEYRLGQAIEEIYQFFWYQFCDKYIEESKSEIENHLPTLLEVLTDSLKLLHPFVPFVTEAVYQELKKALPQHPLFIPLALIVAPWPEK